MYLKSIEINGFKSFANKIDLCFEEGITAIVGPNGSGKSNIADAVRWVLGEQSANKLRGTKMEDVIFAGTMQRKPQAAAYVAITFDNSDHCLPIDYNEVVVARRVYRSGESEYLLNGNVTRLKDITSIFFDTGIGKDGYSIIGQGQVERILSDKPDVRRALFDEAAGIVKYKKNKQITEKQLEQEHLNLNRVNDILSGLEERVEPLREQSEKAKVYLELKDRQKALEINAFLFDVDKLRTGIDAKKNDLQITEDDIERLTKEFDFTKSEYERLEEQLDALNENIEASKQEISDQKLEIEHAEGEMRVIKEKISSEGVISAEISSQIDKLVGKTEELESRKAELEKTHEEISGRLSKVEDNLFEQDNERQVAEDAEDEVASEIEKAKADIIEFINEGGNLKEKIARYDTMLENINLRRSELKSKLLADTSEQSEAELQKKTLDEEMNSIEEELNRNKSKLEKAEKELRTVSENSNTVKSDINKYNQDVIRYQSRYESLRNLTERYEGFGQSIKKVMEKKADNKKIVGVVADIISADKKYETAIETALGGSIQNIVTEDEKTAKDMIAYLRENKLGRATFLPITTVKKRGGVDKDALNEKGVVGVASDLVKTDEKYRGVIESLLGRSIVVENIDEAIRISKKFNQSLKLVTPTGELINPGGAMTGGAFKNNSNLLGRKRELDEIQKAIGDTNNKLKKAREEDANLTMRKESLREEINNLTNKIQTLSIDHNSSALKLKSVGERLEALRTSLASIKKENSELDGQTGQIDKNKKELFDNGKHAEESITEREKLIEELEKKIAEKRDLKHAAEDKVKAINLEAAEIRLSLTHTEEDISRVEVEISEYKNEIKDLKDRFKSNSSSVNTLESELDSHKMAVADAAEKIKEAQVKLDGFVQEKDDINKNHKDFFSKREKLSTDINNLEKSAYQIKLNIEKLEEDKEKLSAYMWEEYELTISSAELMKQDDLGTPSEIKKEIAAVKQTIRSLGDVNVNAIEEFKDVNERYSFLKDQRDDIIQAEDNLRGIIADLDKSMKQIFAEKFKDIQDMFSKVFKEMFGGGNASLELVDQEDLLETGVIINAQPPGKKLQNMMMLSGGEKSLTAICLLFAIQSLKPSPFCLLDEIEAALDDSNVIRYARYLKKLTKDTQFVVITHRKGTMESADILYGITMQEKGVSTLVSVNLIEDKLDN